jgi:hypothetical protein
MKVFVPHKKDRNVYFDEIISNSNCNFIFGNLKEYNTTYDIVNIQFPESIFDWISPNEHQLKDFEKVLVFWKQHSKVVLTLNDYESHYDKKNEFVGLFKLIQEYVDGVIHLGNYSLEKYKHLFSTHCKHTVIYHPLYESLIYDCKTADFQDRFQLNFQDKYVVAVIGCIRSIEEIELIFKLFKKIPVKNKLLIIPNMFQFVNMPTFFPYRFRKTYNKVAEKIFCYPLHRSQYFFGYKFLDYSYMVDLVKKSSLMIIPRIKNLNSGNLFLGLTFDKPMIIPKVGNLTEVADYFNFPVLDIEVKNYEELFSRLLDLKKKKYFNSKIYFDKKKKFNANVIAHEYDVFFKVINN